MGVGSYYAVDLIIVVFPMCPDGPLASEVPRFDFEVALHETLDVESLRGHDLLQVLIRQRLQNCGFTRVVQTQHAQPDRTHRRFLLRGAKQGR